MQWLRTMSIIKMKPVIWSKHQTQMSQDNVLLHDNVYPHTGAHTVTTLQQYWYVALKYPPHSSDLTPRGYHLFGPLWKCFEKSQYSTSWGRQYTCGLSTSQEYFFLKGIQKPAQCWIRCVDKQKGYVEKWGIKFSIVVLLILINT